MLWFDLVRSEDGGMVAGRCERDGEEVRMLYGKTITKYTLAVACGRDWETVNCRDFGIKLLQQLAFESKNFALFFS